MSVWRSVELDSPYAKVSFPSPGVLRAKGFLAGLSWRTTSHCWLRKNTGTSFSSSAAWDHMLVSNCSSRPIRSGSSLQHCNPFSAQCRKALSVCYQHKVLHASYSGTLIATSNHPTSADCQSECNTVGSSLDLSLVHECAPCCTTGSS